jgi:GNAT superfamily N-acetyltransferase
MGATGDERPGGPSSRVAAPLVRPALDVELDAAGAVVRAAYEADGLVDGDYLAVLADARDRARDAVVAVAVGPDGAVVGSVTFTLPGSRWSELARAGQAEFRMLGVLPGARGRGVGAALVDWCLHRARAAGAREVVISSAAAMTAAHRLYTTRGFTRRPELDWSPAPGVDLLGFGLELTPER